MKRIRAIKSGLLRQIYRLFPYLYHDDHQQIRSIADQNGFAVLDLLESFQKCQQQSLAPVFLDHVHPSIVGHECAAEALAEYLRTQNMVAQCRS